MAFFVAMARLMSRPWSSSTLSVMTLPGDPHATQMVPTGISFDPPVGPASPVAAMAKSVHRALQAPSTIATATSSQTAVFSSMSSWGTPSMRSFISLA